MARSYEDRMPVQLRSTAASLLRLARIKSGMSQSALAARAGVPPTMISAYERDKRQPTLETLLRLLKAAGFDLRMHLEPYDDHDDVLAALDAQLSPAERARRKAAVDVWRQATPVPT